MAVSKAARIALACLVCLLAIIGIALAVKWLGNH